MAVGLAGCAGGGGPGGESAGQASTTVIDNFRQDGTEIIVELVNADAADRLQVIAPNGELYAEEDIQDTISTLSFSFTDYTPGEHRFLAVRGDDDTVTVDEATHTIESEITITRVGAAEELDREFIDNTWTTGPYDSSVVFWVENNGTGTAAIVSAELASDFIRPGQELARRPPITIEPGEVRILSIRKRSMNKPTGPFPKSGTFSLSIIDSNGPDIENETYTATVEQDFPTDVYSFSKGTREATEETTTE